MCCLYVTRRGASPKKKKKFGVLWIAREGFSSSSEIKKEIRIIQTSEENKSEIIVKFIELLHVRCFSPRAEPGHSYDAYPSFPR